MGRERERVDGERLDHDVSHSEKLRVVSPTVLTLKRCTTHPVRAKDSGVTSVYALRSVPVPIKTHPFPMKAVSIAYGKRIGADSLSDPQVLIAWSLARGFLVTPKAPASTPAVRENAPPAVLYTHPSIPLVCILISNSKQEVDDSVGELTF